MRLVTGYHLVAALDQMVTGVAGGDQDTAAADGGMMYERESEGEGREEGVLEDQKLTRSSLVRSARPGEVGGARNRR